MMVPQCPPQASTLRLVSAARLKHFGWGREGEGLTAEEEAFVIARAEARFGTALRKARARRASKISGSNRLASRRLARSRSAPANTTTVSHTPTANHTPSSPAV